MSILKAVLGPTNTGKTHYAIERMLAYSSGMMGFPLRLLAREVYDRVVATKGKRAAALITGEEKIIPEGARYYLCTVDAMPRTMGTDFVAIDEVQMCADPQRGHIFTDRLLHCRGRYETLFLGADTMADMIRKLVPEVEIEARPRFSSLSYVKPMKASRLPRRSAIVAFSSTEVYALAELMRRQKGGAAIVMGALSPRTRNAQVEMYQNGDVEYLVATDAIGMGLNMDINHVAFAGTVKYDGRTVRYLTPAELAQVAGRAGRYKSDGTFSTLAGDAVLGSDTVDQIENHYFESVRALLWRNNRLDFTSVKRLIKSLEKPATIDGLHRHRDAPDLLALKTLMARDGTSHKINSPEQVQTLWNVCQVPDFRKLSLEDHISLLGRLVDFLVAPNGKIPTDFMARQVKRLDNPAGDIDTLAGRIAAIRVWTYVAQRKGWLQDTEHWTHVTRSVEDRLSDALHERLTQRFVDRRTSVLMRELRQRGALSVDINEENTVTVEGHDIGKLAGFSFTVDAGAARDDQKTLQAAAESALRSEVVRRAKLFDNVGYRTLELNFDNGLAAPRLFWQGAPIATIHATGAYLAPNVKLVSATLLEGESAQLVINKCQAWLAERADERLAPLLALSRELNGESEAPEGAAPLTGLARGVAFRVVENYGVVARSEVDKDLRQLDQDARKGLRRFGIRIGSSSLYLPFILKPHATELRLMMWAMGSDIKGVLSLPTPGMVWVDVNPDVPANFYEMAGFNVVGKKAIRIDMFERLADAVRPLGQKGEWFEVSPETMGLVGVSGEDFAEVMKGLGYGHEIRNVAAPAKTVEITQVATTETSDNAKTENAPETETASESATEEKPEAAGADAAEKAEVAAPTEAPEGEVDVKPAESDELVERYFFRWAPKRKARAPRPQGQKAADKAAAGRLSGKKFSARTGNKAGKHKQAGAGQKRNAAQREKKADPDSPFAALAGLKKQLEKKK